MDFGRKELNETTCRFLLIATLLFAPFAAHAQTPNTATSPNTPATRLTTTGVAVEMIDFESKLVAEKLPYIVAVPESYNAASSKTARYPVIYLLHGWGGSPKNWVDFGMAKLANEHQIIIVAVQGRLGWYTDAASDPKRKFESYVIQELIPDVDRRYRTRAERSSRAVAGLSMGGYGAFKFAIKYPQMFSFAGSMSGAMAVASWRDETAMSGDRPLTRSIRETFYSPDKKVLETNDLFKLVRDMSAEQLRDLPYLYFDCGTSDLLVFASNRDMASLLLERRIPHEYRQLPGGHNSQYWTAQLPELFRIAAQKLNATTIAQPARRAA